MVLCLESEVTIDPPDATNALIHGVCAFLCEYVQQTYVLSVSCSPLVLPS